MDIAALATETQNTCNAKQQQKTTTALTSKFEKLKSSDPDPTAPTTVEKKRGRAPGGGPLPRPTLPRRDENPSIVEAGAIRAETADQSIATN